MCTPMMAVGLAAAVGGAALKANQQSQANKRARRESDAILERNQHEQERMQGQRRQLFDKDLQAHGAPQQQADANRAAAEIEADYNDAVSDYGADREAIPTDSGKGQDTVSAEYARELADALSHYKSQGKAQAKLAGFDQNNLGLALTQRGNLDKMGVNASLAVSANDAARIRAQQEYQRQIEKGSNFGIGDALALAGTAVSAGSSMLPAAGATAAPTVINASGAMNPAAAGTVFRLRPVSGPTGIY